MECGNIEVIKILKSESRNAVRFVPDFPKLNRLKGIVKIHGKILLQPFDQEGLRVEPLKVNPATIFRMQPCHFVTKGILLPLK